MVVAKGDNIGETPYALVDTTVVTPHSGGLGWLYSEVFPSLASWDQGP